MITRLKRIKWIKRLKTQYHFLITAVDRNVRDHLIAVMLFIEFNVLLKL